MISANYSKVYRLQTENTISKYNIASYLFVCRKSALSVSCWPGLQVISGNL